MGLDFNITGFTIPKKKIKKKGLKYYLEYFRYEHVVRKNEHYELNFDKSYRKPGYFMNVLVNNAHKYQYESIIKFDEGKEYRSYQEVYYYSREEIVDLITNINNNFDELSFDSVDRKYYYDLMLELISVVNMRNTDKIDFYLVLEVNV